MVNPDPYVDYSLPALNELDTYTAPIDETGVQQGGTGPGTLGIPNPIGDALDFVGALLTALANLPQEISSAVNFAETIHPLAVISGMAKYAEQAVAAADISSWLKTATQGGVGTTDTHSDYLTAASNIWNWISKFTGGAFYTAMLNFGLGVDTNKFGDDAKQAVQTTDTLISFTIVLQYAIALLEFAGKGIFANRWAEPLKDAIAGIPEEMGLSWALGLTIDEGFKTATGTAIQEAILRQKRGTGIEWPILRTMFKQHLFDNLKYNETKGIIEAIGGGTGGGGDALLTELLRNQGFSEELIDVIKKLADAQLTIGDLQQMYLYGQMGADEVKDYLPRLGFNEKDTDRLYTHYIDKADTQAGAVYRSTMRSLFRDNIVGEQAYRDALTETHFPKLEIDFDVKAITKEHEVGRTQATTALIKTRYLHNEETADTAKTKLILNGFTPENAGETVASWTLPPIVHARGLTVAQVLSYEASGILTQPAALAKLLSIGVNANDAQFLSEHPTSHTGTTIRKRSPGLVIDAYIAGALDATQLNAAFALAGVGPDDMPLWISTANWRYANRKQTHSGNTPLTKGEVLSLFKLNIWGRETAHQALVNLGYSDSNATLLLEIENKGIFQEPVPPIFATVDDAISYLLSLGFTFNETNTKVLVAESMAEQAGLTPVPPPGFSLTNPYTGDVGGPAGSGGTGGTGTILPITPVPL